MLLNEDHVLPCLDLANSNDRRGWHRFPKVNERPRQGWLETRRLVPVSTFEDKIGLYAKRKAETPSEGF